MRRVERVDTQVRRAARVGRAPDEAHGLAEPAVVGARDRDRAVLGPGRGVDHHRQVDVVEVAQPQQLALAAQELEPPFADLVEAPLKVAAFLGRDRQERHAPGQPLERVRGDQADRRAHQPGDLGVVAARVDGAGGGVRVRMSRDHERVELAQKRERGASARAPRHIRAHTGERQSGPRRQAELAELRLDQRRGAPLLEAELGMAADVFAEPDDLVGVALDRFVDTSLQLVAGHGLLSVRVDHDFPDGRVWRRICEPRAEARGYLAHRGE